MSLPIQLGFSESLYKELCFIYCLVCVICHVLLSIATEGENFLQNGGCKGQLLANLSFPLTVSVLQEACTTHVM